MALPAGQPRPADHHRPSITAHPPPHASDALQARRALPELLQIATAISGAASLPALLRQMFSSARDLTLSDAGSIYLVEEEKGEKRLWFTAFQHSTQTLEGQQRQIDSMIAMLAGAIDARSSHTGRHCSRVPELALLLAGAAEATKLDAPGNRIHEIRRRRARSPLGLPSGGA